MTYLDIVNNVLRRMREDTVSTVTETEYSTMVGDFVNDAYSLVANAWDWTGFRTTLTITTSADVSNYSITDSQHSSRMLTFLNDTSNYFMDYRTQAWMDDRLYIQEIVKGSPRYFTYNTTDSNNDITVDIYPVPDKAYTLLYTHVLRPYSLTNDSDVVTIPTLPIIHMAVALLVRERGETGGTSVQEHYAIADRYLADAIQLDAEKHPEETVFRVV